jgi:cysteine desulfurase
MAELLGAAKPEEIIFTGGGTESDNLAIKGVALANKESGGNHIITSEIEHHAVLYTCEYLERLGFNVTYLPVDKYGRVSPEEVHKAITPRTTVISIMHANNEVGTIQPIAEIGRIVQEENVRRSETGGHRLYFHTDAVQTAGKLKIDVQAMGVDLLSLSAHKFYGPKGVGVLYLRRGTRIQPILHGGHHERNLRAGTENLPGIMGMVKALELAAAEREKEQNRLAVLRDRFEKGIQNAIEAVRFNGQGAARVAGVANVSFQFVEGESMLLSLDLEGIAASTGSACASGSLETSHVLKAMCVEPTTAQGTLRFSLGHQTTDEDIDHVLAVLPRIVGRLREMSPLWKNQHKKQK